MALDITEVVKLTSSLTVLYVEDEEQIRNEMNDMLDDFFHEILLAKDGRDGLEKYTEYHQDRGHYPDIVITDINMPHCSGVEMSEEMLRQNSEQVIIVVSAHNDSDNLLKLINMGVNNYLLKPMKSEQLFQTLYRVAKRVHYKNMESEFSHKTRELNEKFRLENGSPKYFLLPIRIDESGEYGKYKRRLAGFGKIRDSLQAEYQKIKVEE